MENLEKSDTTFQDNSIDDSANDTITENFTKETLLGRLEVGKLDLKQSKELALVEITFNALNVKFGPLRNTSAQNDFASSRKIVDEKIKEGVAFLIEREVDSKKIFKCWNAMNMVIMHPNSLKEKRNTKEDSDQEDLEIACILMKKKKRNNLIRVEVKMN